MKFIIHVNKSHISMNAKDGKNRPVYTIKCGKRIIYSEEIEILGHSKLIYNGTQLSCGARAWIETDGPLRLKNAMPYIEAKEGIPENSSVHYSELVIS